MTVFIYVNTSKQVGDADHPKVFASVDAAEKWFEENDSEGVAFEYPVLERRPAGLPLEKAAGRGDGLSIFHFLFWAIVVGAIMWTGETEASAAPLIEAKTAAAHDGAAVQVACVLIHLTMDSLGE